MADVQKTVKIGLEVEPKLKGGALNDLGKKVAEKVGASPDQLSALRLLASKHAASGGGLAELLPTAQNAGGFMNMIKGLFRGGGSGLGSMVGKLGAGLNIGVGGAGNMLSALVGGNIAGAGGSAMLGAGAGLVGGPAGIAVAAATSALSKMLDVITQIPGRVMGLVHALDAWVRVASPGVSERFHHTMDDLAGVIGHNLTPGLEIANTVFRSIADSMAIVGTSEFKGLFRELGAAFNDMRPALMALVELSTKFVAANAKLAGYAAWAARPATKAAGAFTQGIAYATTGDPFHFERANGASAGAAARQASYTGFAEFGRQNRLLAFTSVSHSPAERAADAAEEHTTLLEDINDKLDSFGDAIRSFADPFGIGKAITGN